ncbi:hypothetical protein Tco_1353050 [Tanacetum coccineum]
MEISIADQIALDDALVAPADRLKIVTADSLPEIYMQEFWASAYVHNRSVRFKMNNKKHILGLDQFRDILQICPKVGNKKFEEPPLEKEILAFLASLGHSGEIRKITDVNVNKLHQPWRSFAAIINKCLSGKPSYDSLRLSQAQILWGMYNKKNVDYAYLLWEDFIYQIENKNTKKGNAMYYPRFTKLVVNFVMDKDPSIPRRNKVNWHYARDDPMFTTINVISRNEDTQLYGTILPVALTNEDIRNFESYKEYYAIASGTIPPKTKGSKKKADTDTTTKQKPPTVPKEKKEKKSGKGKQKTTELETISEAVLTEAEQLKIITKRSRKETHSSHASGSGADEGTGVTPGVPDAPDYDSEDDISWKSSDDDQDDEKAQDDEDEDKYDVNETTQDDEDDDVHDDDENAQDDDDEEQTESEDDGDDFIHPKLTTHDDEIIHEEETDEDDTFDPIVHTPSHISSSDDEDSDNDVEGTDVEGAKSDEDATYEEDQGNEAVEDTNTNLKGRDNVMTDVILPQVQATQEIEDTHVTLTPVNPDGQQQSSSVSSGFVSNMLNPNQDTVVEFPVELLDFWRFITFPTRLLSCSQLFLIDEDTTLNLATWRDFKEGWKVYYENSRNDTLNELKIKESKDAHKLFEKMPMNKLLTDCGHNDRELSKDNMSYDDNQCLGDENDTDVVSENKKIRGLVNLGYGSDGLKVNLSVNGIEEVSDYVMVLDDDCKETELGDHLRLEKELVDDVRCVEAKLVVSEIDDNGNSKEVENNNLVSSDIVLDKFVNKYAKRKECESLSFDKRLDAALDIQIVAAITKTLSCSLRTGIGVNGHNMIVDEGCIQKDIHLFGICHDLKHVEGQEDEYRSFKVTDAHSSDKISTCVDERYMQEEGLGKGIIGEEEMNINEKHKEELDKVTIHPVHMASEIRNSPLVLRTTYIRKLEVIRPGIEVKRGSSNVDDTSVVLSTKFEKTKAYIQVTQEDKEDDVVRKDEKVVCLGTLDYGVDGMKNNASTMGVSKIVVVDVYDSMFNFSERYGSTDFNKLVEMYNGKYDDNKEEDDDFVVCDLVQSKVVDVLGKDYGTGFIKGLEDVNRTGNVSVQAFYIDNHPQIVQMCDFKLEQERSESLFPTFGSNGLADNGGICKPKLETLGQILQWLIPNPNRIMTNSGGTDSYDQTFTYGMEIEITMSGLNGYSLIVDLEAAKMNKVSFGLLKFDIWKWPKRGKKKSKHGKWKFDVWIWPNRKKKWEETCYGVCLLSPACSQYLQPGIINKVLSNNGTRVPGQVSNLVPDPLLHQGNIEVPAIVFVHEVVPELLDVDEDTGIERAYSSPC